MFTSPCISRSTKCAALIALAAAAGLARIDAGDKELVDRRTQNAVSASTSLTLHLYCPSPSCWSKTPAAFAIWYACSSVIQNGLTDAFRGKHSRETASMAEVAQALFALCSAAPSSALPSTTTDQPDLCCRPYLLPFAAGPPRHSSDLQPTAAGTKVPGNSAANGKSVCRVAAPDELSSPYVARLARLCSFGPLLLVNSFARHFALRGDSAPARNSLSPHRIALLHLDGSLSRESKRDPFTRITHCWPRRFASARRQDAGASAAPSTPTAPEVRRPVTEYLPTTTQHV